jgi:hypothetical protein
MHSLFLSRSRLTDALRRRWQSSALRARCLEWDVEFAVDVHTMTFSYPPVAGRHTLNANVRIGHRDLWIQRWHTAACGQRAVVSMARCWPCVASSAWKCWRRRCASAFAELQSGNRMEDRMRAVVEPALQGEQP